MAENGELHEEKALPVIGVAWDAGAQQTVLQFDNEVFRRWDFVIAILRMAVTQAEDMKRATQVEQMRQAAVADQRAFQEAARLKQLR